MIKTLCFLLLFSLTMSSYAGNQLPFNDHLREQINSRFLENGDISHQKLNSYVSEIRERREEVSSIIKNYYKKLKKRGDIKVQNELNGDDAVFTYNLILEYVSEVRRESDIVKSQLLLEKVLELDDSAKSFGRLPLLSRIKKRLKSTLGSSYFVNRKDNVEEASNLYSPRTGQFFSKDEIAQMAAEGRDISLLEPNPKSRFWSPTTLDGMDISTFPYRGSRMYEGLDIEFPEGEATYKAVRKSQTKPKFDINFETIDKRTGKKIKQKYKIKLASEIHSEITAGILASILGFYADISKFEKEFKLVLPKGTSVREVREEWYSYYNTFDFDKYIKKIGKTKKGRDYIILKDVLIEAKPKGLKRIGRWSHGSLSHKGLRELRGLFLFNAWIANTDLKESDNNKIVLREDENGNQEMFQFIHDLGSSFGHYVRESPKNFRWEIANLKKDGSVYLDFRQFQVNSKFDHISYYDAKWMVRKIAKISRAQMTQAVELAGWPESAGKLIIEKLISRRNNLVKVFGLEGEIGVLPIDRYLTTADKVVENGNYYDSRAPEHSIELKGDLALFGDQLKESVEQLSIATAVKALSKGNVRFESEDFGLDSKFFGQIDFRPNRVIERNLNQKGRDDYYLVHDSLRMRVALGAGFVLRGSVAYFKEYRISYTAKTYKEAASGKNFIVDLYLNKTIRNDSLPVKSITTISDGFEGQGSLRLRTGSIGIRAEAGARTGIISSLTLARKNNKFLVSKEKGRYFNIFQELDFTVFFLRYQFFSNTNEIGFLTNSTYKLEYNDSVSDNQKINSTLYDVLYNSNLNLVRQYGKEVDLRSDYVSKRSDINFFLWKKSKNFREDQISRHVTEKDGSTQDSNFYQIKVGSSFSRSAIISGEFKSKSVRVLAKMDENGGFKSPIMKTWITIEDQFTESHELEDYIRKVNQLATDKKFINFDPYKHSKNNYWGKVSLDVQVSYGEEAIDKLLNTSKREFFETMAENTNRDAAFWSSKIDNDIIDKRSRKLRSVYQSFVKRILKAQREHDTKKKFSLIAQAINNKLLRKDGESFSATLLNKVHSIIGLSNLYIEASLSTPAETESVLISKLDIYNNLNPELEKKVKFFEFNQGAGMEFWSSIMDQF